MNAHTLWIGAIAFCLAACSRQEPPEPQAPENEQVAVPAEEMQETEAAFDEAFINHMHDHAAKLYDLTFALAEGDLEGAATPAFWLARHDTAEGVPRELRGYLTDMRNAAYDVEMARDLETARAAAKRISAQCEGCHVAAGISVPE